MEAKLRTSMMKVKDPIDFINRPIAFILFTLIILVILLQVRTLWKSFKNK
jgi:putative tricarboxylic transport membrane protein